LGHLLIQRAQFEKIVLMYEGNDLLSEDFIKRTINVFQDNDIGYTVFKQNPMGAWEKGNL